MVEVDEDGVATMRPQSRDAPEASREPQMRGRSSVTNDSSQTRSYKEVGTWRPRTRTQRRTIEKKSAQETLKEKRQAKKGKK